MSAQLQRERSDLEIVDRWRNCRALARRKHLSRPIREHLPEMIAKLERQAYRRGVTLDGWREYPRSLSFGHRMDESGKIEHVTPPPRRKHKRKRTTSGLNAADFLAALETSVEVNRNTGNDEL